jgi:hypothetical protein
MTGKSRIMSDVKDLATKLVTCLEAKTPLND